MILLANLHLVTGYAGAEHVRAVDQGAFNAALIGTGQFVLDKGNVLKAQVISNNTVRVLDGELMMQGRFVRLNPGTYVDLAIENGAQGMKRNDLVVARYTKNSVTGVEECNLVVIKGTATASNPSDPAHTEGDITNGNSIRHDFPLWRLPIDGLNVGTPVALFGEPFMDSMRTLPGIRADVNAIHNKVNKQLAEQDKEIDAKISSITSYLKPEELSDGTKTLYGFDSSAVPDNVFSTIHSSLLGKVEMEIVSYTGTGTAGQSNPTSVTFSKAPSLIIMLGYKDRESGQWYQKRYGDEYDYVYMLPTDLIQVSYTRSKGFGYERNYEIYGKKSVNGRTFSWYSYNKSMGDGTAAEQCNESGYEYYVLGLSIGNLD